MNRRKRAVFLDNISDRITINYEGKPCYNIVFTNEFESLKVELEKLNVANKRICIVTESNVGPLYADKIKSIVETLCKKVIVFQFNAGEANKNLDVINNIYEVLIENKFDRNDMLVALGGGVVGDMTGFAAATYLRGIDFIQMPTSLLSQVDSSIGGKTGVDFKAFKNMVGAFYQPKLVYMNLDVLNSLPEREYLSGMGEILKHGLIKDREFFYWLKDNRKSIMERDYETVKIMVCASCNVKKEVVENDPKEKGERALLNFGHTIGHAVEKLKDFSLLHGECVAIGMNAAAYISLKKGNIGMIEYSEICDVLSDYELPVFTDNLVAEEVAEATLNDKKMDSGVIKFVVLESVGKAEIDRTISKEAIIEACAEIIK